MQTVTGQKFALQCILNMHHHSIMVSSRKQNAYIKTFPNISFQTVILETRFLPDHQSHEHMDTLLI